MESSVPETCKQLISLRPNDISHSMCVCVRERGGGGRDRG
jgi:hypothetical protein